mmetsp:Transcript_31526/g.82392  ORF Transcript_31526/g.82392 Transcript_31526/m.82392 type:complete len:86 (-) Transcript_31526:1733-1990(-)
MTSMVSGEAALDSRRSATRRTGLHVLAADAAELTSSTSTAEIVEDVGLGLPPLFVAPFESRAVLPVPDPVFLTPCTSAAELAGDP